MDARTWIMNWEALSKERPELKNGLTGISGQLTEDGFIKISRGLTDYFILSFRQAEVIRDWLIEIFPLVDCPSVITDTNITHQYEAKAVEDKPEDQHYSEDEVVEPYHQNKLKESKTERAFLTFGEKT